MARRRIRTVTSIALVTWLLAALMICTVVTWGMRAGDDTRIDRRFAADRARSADRVTVLCYHYVRGPVDPLQFTRVFGYVVLSLPLIDDSELWKVNRRAFEHQMEYLATRGYHTV